MNLRLPCPYSGKTFAIWAAMQFDCDCILLDIEGTTSSISFVHEEMFPFVRSNLLQFLAENWDNDSVLKSVQLIAKDANLVDWPDAKLSAEAQQQQVAAEVNRQMDQDLKATGLKNLQGKIWKSGFESGALQAHIYDDTRPAIESWIAAGKDVRIYSSGSVQAQILFFGHTVSGNLLDYFSGHYDTQIGGKKESVSYTTIAKDIGLPPTRILFISDILEELEAAQAAGFQTALSIRQGNTPVETPHSHPEIHSLQDFQVE